ncbi:hypothetical protein Tco_0728377 [Tanacetum coccineum]|uniref:Uncharacterized protein n=1 Tax=Tanacetum coccineum TaxID=301880 RepID=A0ABQ4YNA0_9ASTR
MTDFPTITFTVEAHRVFEQEIQGASKTFSSAQNVAFVSQSKSSTNKVKSGFTGAYSTCTPSTSSTNIPEKEALAGFADEVIYSLFAKQLEDCDLLHEDLEQIDDLDIKEMDINWQDRTDCYRMKMFYKKNWKESSCCCKGTLLVSDKRRLECFYCHKNWYFARGEHTENEETNHALMAISSSSEILRVPSEGYVSTPITTNEKGMTAPKPKEVEPSCASHIKAPRQPIKDQATPKVNRKNWNAMVERELGKGYSFTKKKCFVCGSLSHLIKDCDYYEKKMAREAAPKKQRVFNTGNGVTKPVWNNADRINHANHFVPRSVILNSGRPNVNSVRPNVNTVRTNINSVRQNVNSVWSNVNTGSFNVNSVRPKQPVPTSNSPNFSSERPQVNKFNQRSNFSKSHSSVRRPFAKNTAQMSHSHAVKGNWGSAVKTSAGNKDQLEDFEEFNGGSVTFGGSKGYITGTSEVTHSAGTSQTPNANASEEKDEDAELIVVPSAVKNTAEKVETRKSSTNTKEREILTRTQQRRRLLLLALQKIIPKILAFRRELEKSLQKQFIRHYLKTTLQTLLPVNSGSEPVILVSFNPDYLAMLELRTFHNYETRNLMMLLNDEEDKYVAEILKKFDLVSVKTTITPMETKVALTKDEAAVDVEVTTQDSHQIHAVK